VTVLLPTAKVPKLLLTPCETVRLSDAVTVTPGSILNVDVKLAPLLVIVELFPKKRPQPRDKVKPEPDVQSPKTMISGALGADTVSAVVLVPALNTPIPAFKIAGYTASIVTVELAAPLLLSMTTVSCGNGKLVTAAAPPLDAAHRVAASVTQLPVPPTQ